MVVTADSGADTGAAAALECDKSRKWHCSSCRDSKVLNLVATAGTATYAGALTALEICGKIICWTDPDIETAGTTTLKETAGCSTDVEQ